MIKSWFIPDLVAAVFICIVAAIILGSITSEQSSEAQAAGAIWMLCGIALTAYCSKNMSKAMAQAGYVPLAFGVSSIFFGLAIALASPDLLRDIVSLAFLAILVMSVIVIVAWLRRVLSRKVWT